MLNRVPVSLDKILDASGKILLILPLVLILVQFSIVLMVYVFRSGSIQLQESLQYINAIMFLAGAGYTALADEHVRVDLFYSKFTEKQKARVNFFGTLLLLLPFLILFFLTALPYALESWAILEASVETSGLPFVYILKTTLLLFPLTLAFHVVSTLIRTFQIMRTA
ncbi:MAG: TRAP transporter small permease subunit [Kordiimonadaceae bacterium]|nr:TRAP transporter small permease subunit [Kordiimonadaceae bacterium]